MLEAVFRFDVFGIALTAFFLVLAGVGALLLFQPWLERWYYHRVRAGRWEEY